MRSTGDADAFLQGLKDKSVHAAITDPPWDIMMGHGLMSGSAGTWKVRGEIVMKASLPYQTRESRALAHSLAILKKKLIRGGALITFLPGGKHLWEVLDQFDQDGWTRNRLLIWDKAPYGGGGIGGFWRNAFEPICMTDQPSSSGPNITLFWEPWARPGDSNCQGWNGSYGRCQNTAIGQAKSASGAIFLSLCKRCALG